MARQRPDQKKTLSFKEEKKSHWRRNSRRKDNGRGFTGSVEEKKSRGMKKPTAHCPGKKNAIRRTGNKQFRRVQFTAETDGSKKREKVTSQTLTLGCGSEKLRVQWAKRHARDSEDEEQGGSGTVRADRNQRDRRRERKNSVRKKKLFAPSKTGFKSRGGKGRIIRAGDPRKGGGGIRKKQGLKTRCMIRGEAEFAPPEEKRGNRGERSNSWLRGA